MKCIIKVLNLALAVILVGIMVGVWLGFNPSGLAASAYVDRQQAMIRALNTPMPVVGAVTILLALVSAYLRRAYHLSAVLLVAGALLLIGSGVVIPTSLSN